MSITAENDFVLATSTSISTSTQYNKTGNSNKLSPIFNRRPSLFLSRAELRHANASSLAALPQWKLDRSFGDASWRIYDDGSTRFFNLLDEELGNFVGVDVS